MAMRCELTGKSPQTGNNVSHAKNRTKRRFLPNLQNITFISEKLGQKIQLRVAAKEKKSIKGCSRKNSCCFTNPHTPLTGPTVQWKGQEL